MCLAILLALPAGAALAADINVDADCSLANAVKSANGADQVAPANSCETGDSASADNTGSDTITITQDGAADGTISLDAQLEVTSEIVVEGMGYTVDGNSYRIFDVSAGSLTLKDLTVTGGWTSGVGGGIKVSNASLALYNSVVRHNWSAGVGGGISAVDSDVLLMDSVVSSNQTNKHASADGSRSIDSDNAPGEVSGGGIHFRGADNNLIIDKSGVSNNSSASEGGGIHVADGSAAITNSTISGNTATNRAGGLLDGGAASLTHVTVIENTAPSGAGVIPGGSTSIVNSILTGNIGGDCAGTLNSNFGNLIRDNSCGHTGLNTDPMLLLLAGAPAYYTPEAGSPVIDAGDPAFCLANDQRGLLRPPDACDIGAAESEEGAFAFQMQSAFAAQAVARQRAAENGNGDGNGSGSGAGTSDGNWSQPDVSLCESLTNNIVVADAPNTTHCRIVDATGVGNATLVEYGFIYAVDIFGYLSHTVDACFKHDSGAVILLDAAYSPRIIVPQRTRTVGTMRCATIDRPGTAVLMPLDFLTSGNIAEPVYTLSGCQATATDFLNLRAQPSTSAAVLNAVPATTTLNPDMRNTYWFRVTYSGQIGWLHGDYLTTVGSCE